MLWRNLVVCAVFIGTGVAQVKSTAWAQNESREERFFRYLDRDNDGRIAGEELSRLDDRMKERFKEAGLDASREVSRDAFIRGMQQRSENSSRGGGDSRGSRGSSRPAPKPKVVQGLPTKFAPFDQNGDNQIGLYEWERAKLSEFLQLDRNGDGFLTARELNDSNVAAVTVTATPQTLAPTSVAASEKPASPASPVAPPTESDSTEVRQAKYFFSLVDKDKNGEISTDEWSQNRGTRSMFERGKITPTLPMKQDQFVAQYLVLKGKSASN
ncbi:hypothetical protein GC163_19465 [bacterium]|nr:hypothetical protein [bacterium]